MPEPGVAPVRMEVSVKVRDAKFRVKCGRGNQTVLWLANVAKNKYSAKHAHLKESELQAVDASQNGCLLLPNLRLRDSIDSELPVVIELCGPGVGPNDDSATRSKTMWERFAYTPESNMVKVCFKFTGGVQHFVREDPGLFGNFNAWGVPFVMERIDDDNWEYIMELPAYSEIVFAFAVNGETAASDLYEKVRVKGNTFNYIKVSEPYHNYEELKAVVPDPASYFTKSPKITMKRIPAEVAGVQSFSGIKIFEGTILHKAALADLEKALAVLRLTDVLESPQRLSKLEEIVKKHYQDIDRIFRYYSAHGGRDFRYMGLLKWINFCRVCKLIDAKLSVGFLDSVFYRVNLGQGWVKDEIAEAQADSLGRPKIKLLEDPEHPDNMFTRAEFLAALLRISIEKAKSLSVDVALNTLLRDNVMKYGMAPATDDISDLVTNEDCQRVLRLFSKRIMLVYRHYHVKGRNSAGVPPISAANFEKMMVDFDAVDANLSIRSVTQALAMSGEDINELTYGQFLEALARVASTKFEPKKDDVPRTLAEKLEMLMTHMFPTPANARVIFT